MNLIIDVGNTYTKLAVFNSNQLLEKYVINDSQSKEKLSVVLNNYPKISHSIISVVGKWQPENEAFLKAYTDVLMLNTLTKVPFVNQYKTPKTLGIDRIALASAAAYQYPNKNVLIIDAGTCVTYDFLNSNNEYLGGAISPGLGIRYKSLNHYTEKLPLLEVNAVNNNSLIGFNTESSIHSGVINGLIFEIKGSILEYKKQFPDLIIILTGGDTKILAKQLKSTIFANQNFLIEGLNYILEHNKFND